MVIPQRQATNDSDFDHLRQEYGPKSNMPQAEISSRQSPFLRYSSRVKHLNSCNVIRTWFKLKMNLDVIFWILIHLILSAMCVPYFVVMDDQHMKHCTSIGVCQVGVSTFGHQ